ncbi:hypothetical protein M9H77_27905 [Catharanthus roseus]|uniref:Uncharacterized protein n=1 Tax=Catharanthus roseus TaxID=4058 RepID=A0ACC0ADU2_CATRO|nr:hypothetical protein M9H77_27905 [Catharanthus roseus]
MKLIHCLNWSYYNFFYYVMNLDFDNLFFSETLCFVFYSVNCSCLEDRMLNYKEHLSKSPHAQPNKNWIDMFVCKFPANIYPAHKHMVLYCFLYILQEHDNNAMYILNIYHKCIIFHLFLKYKRCCQFRQGISVT